MKYAKNAILWSRIRKLRKKSGLSQEGLARKAGITTASIAKIEIGGSANPAIRTIMRHPTGIRLSFGYPACSGKSFSGEKSENISARKDFQQY